MDQIEAMHGEVAAWTGVSAPLAQLQHTLGSLLEAKREVRAIMADASVGASAHSALSVVSRIQPMNRDLQKMIDQAP